MPRTGKKAPPIDKYGLHKQDNRGANTVMTPAILLQIEELVKGGKTNPEVITILGINDNTWYSWLFRDTQGLSEKIGEWRRAYLLAFAEQQLTKLANSKSERIALDAVRFLAERLGKKNYATRQEYQQLDENEGKELEPENKEKLKKLLQDKPKTENILSPFTPSPMDTKGIDK